MNILPFSDTIAHPGDPLTNHLERVASQARDGLQPADGFIRLHAVMAGLCHDLGKATWYFQQWRLVDDRQEPLTNHSQLSGVLFWWLSQGLVLDSVDKIRLRCNVLTIILRHHGNLYASQLEMTKHLKQKVKEGPARKTLLKQLNSIDLSGLISWFEARMDQFAINWQADQVPPASSTEIVAGLDRISTMRIKMALKKSPTDPLQEVCAFLAGYGALLAADKIDTALAGERINRVILPSNLVARYKEKEFDTDAAQKPINQLRRKIAAVVDDNLLSSAHHHAFTLTAPTGSGKTLAVLEAVFRLRDFLTTDKKPPPRIIYCLPFTTIIDQNYQVISDILETTAIDTGQDVLLKHHHLSETRYSISKKDTSALPCEFEADGAGQLLTETWQSEIVVTTFYQLLHTFFTDKNRNLKRHGQLADAIVILDEVQAIPLRYWDAVRRLFTAASAVYNTRFILMTATQPLIFSKQTGAVELLPDHEKYFSQLSRTAIYCHHRQQVNLADFAELIARDFLKKPESTLIIVNRKKSVEKLRQLLKRRLSDFQILCLSTNLTPLDRKNRIKEIQELVQGKPILVVTTQLVEAGVDISFPVVHRDLAPLDSIIQSCGRCNRHNETTTGQVHLWQLVDTESRFPRQPLWNRVYDSHLIDATCEVLAGHDQIPESDFIQLGRRYFKICHQRSQSQPVEELLGAGDFSRLAAEFKLIEDDRPMVSVFVINDQADQKLWERYQALDEIESPLDRRREFFRFKFDFLERIVQVAAGRRHFEKEIIAIREADGLYDPDKCAISLPEDEGKSWTMI